MKSIDELKEVFEMINRSIQFELNHNFYNVNIDLDKKFQLLVSMSNYISNNNLIFSSITAGLKMLKRNTIITAEELLLYHYGLITMLRQLFDCEREIIVNVFENAEEYKSNFNEIINKYINTFNSVIHLVLPRSKKDLLATSKIILDQSNSSLNICDVVDKEVGTISKITKLDYKYYEKYINEFINELYKMVTLKLRHPIEYYKELY